MKVENRNIGPQSYTERDALAQRAADWATEAQQRPGDAQVREHLRQAELALMRHIETLPTGWLWVPGWRRMRPDGSESDQMVGYCTMRRERPVEYIAACLETGEVAVSYSDFKSAHNGCRNVQHTQRKMARKAGTGLRPTYGVFAVYRDGAVERVEIYHAIG